jgi:serine/threonine-protein kinase
MDFGIAKTDDEDQGAERPGRVVGTPQYMALEQWRGERVDARADVYAFGVVLYEMLVGKPPYQGRSTRELIKNRLEKKLEPPSRHAKAISPALDAIVLKCLELKPEDRFASMEVLAQALRAEASANAPSNAPVRRLPGWTWGVVLGSAALVAGLVASRMGARASESWSGRPALGAMDAPSRVGETPPVAAVAAVPSPSAVEASPSEGLATAGDGGTQPRELAESAAAAPPPKSRPAAGATARPASTAGARATTPSRTRPKRDLLFGE